MSELALKDKKLAYVTPKIITYSEDEILEMIGPANTCGSPFFGHGHGHGYGHGHGHGHGHHW